ncbi:hypothetical protein GGF46_003836 [Coemansia sp. RSA 552]|nr:hypothetical protein GGF46_003836 [Coemansia sp. RSA 552]
MAYRKRSLDLPLPPGGQAESGSKHPRNSHGEALPPIRSLAEIAGHGEYPPRGLPSLQSPVGLRGDRPLATRRGDPSLSLAAIRVSSPGGRMSVSPGASPVSSASPGALPAVAPLSAPVVVASAASGSEGAVKVARNWSREETLSLVRAIGRHYESLKRCKTNQERSNVWHRIHKEHSSKFPGRSKKASQDRWGKVLSDYKDVVVHNKEKGAARWTFDFFKEVATIVDSDSQFMELATSPPLFSPRPQSATSATLARSDNVAMAADDLGSYSFGGSGASTAAMRSTQMHVSSAGGSSVTAAAAVPPPTQHRMSEPNMAPHYGSHVGMRAPHAVHSNKLSPIELCPATGFSSVAAAERRGTVDGRCSPSRRTSYPQMQAHAMAVGAMTSMQGSGPGMVSASNHHHLRSSTNGSGRQFPGLQRHSIQVLSPPPPPITTIPYPPPHLATGAPGHMLGGGGNAGMATPSCMDSPSVRVSPSDFAEPEKACRYVLDMLEGQVR